MRKGRLHIIFLICCLSTSVFGQREDNKLSEGLNNISNLGEKFTDAFFNALSNRAVEKYNQAIDALDICMEIDDSKPVLHYEYAQNQIELKNYKSAQDYLEFALSKMPDNIEILKSLARVHFLLQNFDARIATYRKLSEVKSKFRYDLAQAYMYTQQYGEALKTLNLYQKEYGYDLRVNSLKNRIYTASKDKLPVIVDLEKALLKNPKNQEAYIQLIDVYKKNNEEEKAKQTITRFREAIPNSPMMEYINFQEFLDAKDTVNAAASMKRITANSKISEQIKKRVLSDFKIFGRQNPNYNKSLDSLSISSNTPKNHDENLKFIMELSSLQINQGTTESLLEVYQKNLDEDSNNYDLIKDTVLLLLYYNKLDKASTLVEIGLEKYPSQPLLYLIKGTILSKKGKHSKAINNFKDGLDYIVDNPKLERALYLKLAQSYEINGESDKAKKYKNKGEKINVSE